MVIWCRAVKVAQCSYLGYYTERCMPRVVMTVARLLLSYEYAQRIWHASSL